MGARESRGNERLRGGWGSPNATGRPVGEIEFTDRAGPYRTTGIEQRGITVPAPNTTRLNARPGSKLNVV